ncbi:PIN domain nuclease [Rhizobium sp. P32RR-XVIII]|uniref:type II toxin-antitoxin system VapC family toxin n=1 Tax=Rhizobium sp. P32RR-XVIII TaxID=2726738 RepID=UPI001456BEE1|nr:PIN domain-containing protein [Rhizobium sp. P32RR-XVIII]NLS02898.1 PIN domain nuclease [Rhizobium sp. P32RR-XVIII]
MILVDTSVWVDHLRASDPNLRDFLEAREVLSHPFIIGEISLGNLPQYDLVLSSLELLPKAVKASDEDVLHLIKQRKLFGIGIGYVDAHLLASVLLTPEARLWTRDKRLEKTAWALGRSLSNA